MKQIDRRTLLRGTGAVVALPLLECMAGDAPDESIPAARRAAFFYVPNGVVQEDWHVTELGRDWQLSATLQPLADVKSRVALFSGLDRVKVAGTDGHAQAGSCWLSSARPDELSPAGYPLAQTLDQKIAEHLGQWTPFRSLELSCNSFRDNRESIYFDNISWYGHGHAAASMRQPRRVFERLFQISGRQLDASILDVVLDDARSMRRDLGSLDRRKLDEYLQSVRRVEQQIERMQQRLTEISIVDPRLPQLPWWELPRDQYIQIMADLVILAFQTDLTRVASMMISPERWSTPQRIEGVFDQPIVHHSMSHEQYRPEVQRDLARLDRFHVQQFAEIIRKMDAVPERGGTLLGQSILVFGSGLSSGKTHIYTDLPTLVAGGGGGAVNLDRHHRAPDGTPIANLYLAIARAMGVPIDRFGDSTEPLAL